MAKRWRRGFHVLLVGLLVGLFAVDTASACRLFGRRSVCSPSPAIASHCADNTAPAPGADVDNPHHPAEAASPSDSTLPPEIDPAPSDIDSPAIPAAPETPAPDAAPSSQLPAIPVPAPPVAPIPAIPVPTTPEPVVPAPETTTPVPPSSTPPAPPLPTPPAAETFDDLFPPAAPATPATPKATTPTPPAAPSPDEDDPFAPSTPAPPAAPAPAVDDDDPFAPAPAGNRASRPEVPASPPPADPFANPFQTSSAGALPMRAWNDDSGLFQIRGRLIAVLDGKVRILKTTGRTTTVSLSRLSSADREYVAGVVRSSERAVPQVAAR
jgi:hypothetical protein